MTPTYDTYVDDIPEGTPDAPNKDLDTMPKACYNYVNADVMLLHGGTLTGNKPLKSGVALMVTLLGDPVTIPSYTHSIIWLRLEMVK